jgi:hypothetical protein
MSRGLSRDSSSTTSPCTGSSTTTSSTPRVRVPRHVMRLVTRLVVDYFDYVVRPGTSAHRVAHHATHRAARCRLLRIRRASGCLGTSGCLGMSRGSSCRSSLTTSPTLRVQVPRHVAGLVTQLFINYFTYALRPVASACRVTHRRLLCLAQARR